MAIRAVQKKIINVLLEPIILGPHPMNEVTKCCTCSSETVTEVPVWDMLRIGHKSKRPKRALAITNGMRVSRFSFFSGVLFAWNQRGQGYI